MQSFGTPAAASAAVSSARQTAEDDIPLLTALANKTADPTSWVHLRDAGVVEIFIDIILRADARASQTSSEAPLWTLPLQGLFNSLVGIQHTPGAFKTPENHEAALKLLKGSPAICGRLYSEKATICGEGIHQENIRGLIVMWIQAIWNGAPMLDHFDIQREIKESHVIGLATWSWLFASSVPIMSKAATTIREVLDQPQPTKSDLDQIVAAAGSFEELANRINMILRNVDVLDEDLVNSMELLTALTSQTVHAELSGWFSKMSMQNEILGAVRRQLAHQSDSQESWRVLESAGTVVVNLVNDGPSPTEELTDMIKHKSLIPLLGGVLLQYAKADRQLASWSSLIMLLKHTCTCTSQSCRIRTSPAYVAALRQHLTWRWWPTLQRLRSIPAPVRPKIEKEWITLGRMVQFDEATQRHKHHLGEDIDGCWWVECVRDVGPSPTAGDVNPALRRCSGCKKARYCTAECQNKDWKGHKKLCKNEKK